MLTEKAKEQEQMLDEYEARDQEYELLEREGLQLREDNTDLSTQVNE